MPDVDAAVERLRDYVAHGAPFDHIGSIVVVLDALAEARRNGRLVLDQRNDARHIADGLRIRAEAAEAERDELAKFKENALRTFDTLERQRNEAEADLRKCGLRGEGLATDRRDAIERGDAAEAERDELQRQLDGVQREWAYRGEKLRAKANELDAAEAKLAEAEATIRIRDNRIARMIRNRELRREDFTQMRRQLSFIRQVIADDPECPVALAIRRILLNEGTETNA